MTPAERKARLVRRLERAEARILEAKLLLKTFGPSECVEIAVVAAQSELIEAEQLNSQAQIYGRPL